MFHNKRKHKRTLRNNKGGANVVENIFDVLTQSSIQV